MSSSLQARAVVLGALVCGLALALPFWVGRVVPLLDLPQHLAVVSVLRHGADPVWGYAPFFDTEWLKPTPYWTHYVVTYVLSLAMPVETASRVYLTIYALLVPWAGIALCRAFGRSPWLGLLAAPLALNTNLYLGFVNYCSAVVIALWLIADVERGLPSAGRWWRHAAGAALLFFAHVQVFAFYVAIAAFLAMTRGGAPWRRRLREAAAALPATLGLMAPWVYVQMLAPRQASGHYAFGRPGRMGAVFQPLSMKLSDLPMSIAGAFQDHSDMAILAVWALLVVAALVLGRERLSVRAAVPSLLALVSYFSLPMSIAGQWNIGPRFAWLAMLLLLPLAAATGRRATALGVAAVALTVVVGANAAREHRRFDREAGAFDQAIAAIPRGSRVMPLIFENRGRVLEQWPYLHMGQYAMVRRGGLTSANLGRYEPFPIRMRDAATLPALDPFRPGDFRYEAMAPFYDYFLVRDPDGASRGLFPHPPAFAEGGWSLYASPLAARPVTR